MCSKERLLEERVEGAETLAYLIETDVELQRIASITDHLIVMLADYFKYPSSVSAITDIKRVRSPSESLKNSSKWAQDVSLFYLTQPYVQVLQWKDFQRSDHDPNAYSPQVFAH